MDPIQLGLDYSWGVEGETDRRVDRAVRASNCLDFGAVKDMAVNVERCVRGR